MTTTFAATDTLHLTNLNKVFWPEHGYTKRDLIDYYREIAPVILPYLIDRPQVLHRHVDGHAGKEFFQRVSRQCPPWVKIAHITLDGGEKTRDFHLCQDWPTLLWLANFGCVELIPWASRVRSLDYPDYLVVDLDPDDVTFNQVVEVALTVRKVLDQTGAQSLCKTSGKRGLHVYVPFGARYTYDQARQFAQLVATLVHRQLPGSTSLIRNPALRRGRVYLDVLQNRRSQTLAAVYSVRPTPGATVSTPLQWREVNDRLDPTRFTMESVPKRLDKIGDVWEPILGAGIDLKAWMQRIAVE